MLGFLHEPVFDSQLDVSETESSRTRAGGGEAGIVRRKNRRGGNDDVEVNVGKSAPVELQGRPNRVGFHGGAVRRSECIELVVPEINWLRIVGLKRRTGQCSVEAETSTASATNILSTVVSYVRLLCCIKLSKCDAGLRVGPPIIVKSEFAEQVAPVNAFTSEIPEANGATREADARVLCAAFVASHNAPLIGQRTAASRARRNPTASQCITQRGITPNDKRGFPQRACILARGKRRDQGRVRSSMTSAQTWDGTPSGSAGMLPLAQMVRFGGVRAGSLSVRRFANRIERRQLDPLDDRRKRVD